MKTLKLFTLLLAVGIISTSCKKDPTETPDNEQQIFGKALAGTWAAGPVEKDGEDITGEYNDLEITLTAETADAASIGGTISATGDELDGVGKIIGSGTWKFSGSGIGSIDLEGGALITELDFSNVSADKKSFTAEFTRTDVGGRVMGLTGDYVIEFTKK